MSQVKTTRELMAIVKEDMKRLDRFIKIWDELMPYEQEELIETAREMLERGRRWAGNE